MFCTHFDISPGCSGGVCFNIVVIPSNGGEEEIVGGVPSAQATDYKGEDSNFGFSMCLHQIQLGVKVSEAGSVIGVVELLVGVPRAFNFNDPGSVTKIDKDVEDPKFTVGHFVFVFDANCVVTEFFAEELGKFVFDPVMFDFAKGE